MLFKIFLYFLYIMSLSIYIFVAYYLSKSKLAQVVSGWTPNLLVWGSNPLGSKQMGEHCSASDFRWPALTMRYIGKNRRFIAKSVISHDKSRNITGPIFLHEISCRNPSIHDIFFLEHTHPHVCVLVGVECNVTLLLDIKTRISYF